MWSRVSGKAAAAVGVVLAVAIAATDLGAAVDHGAVPRSREIIVYETGRSPYSQIFRDTFAAKLEALARAQHMTLRFVDILIATATEESGLAAPITVVPTLVLREDGAERGRITGLFGPADYDVLLRDLIGPVPLPGM